MSLEEVSGAGVQWYCLVRSFRSIKLESFTAPYVTTSPALPATLRGEGRVTPCTSFHYIADKFAIRPHAYGQTRCQIAKRSEPTKTTGRMCANYLRPFHSSKCKKKLHISTKVKTGAL